MGRSSRDSAVRPDRESGCIALRVAARPLRSLILLGLALLMALAATSTAMAAETHVFSAGKSFFAEGECKLTEPGGIAVNDTTGDIFVFDRGANAIDRFDKTGKCLTKKRFGLAGSVGEETNEGIAVNNDPTSNAFGDVYVVNAEKKDVLKFQPETGGENKLNLVGTIKKFRRKENGEVVEEFEEFEEIHGLSVDGQGNLWVAEAEALDEFAPVEVEPPKRELAARIEVPGTSCAERPGFALTADAKTFYLGRERENRKEECEEPTVVMKLNELAEPVTELAFNAQLDLEPTSGVAVDHSNGVVYFDNKTSLSAFAASEDFIERFGHGASEGELQESTGVAVNSSTHEVFALDAHEDRVIVFVPGTPPVEGTPPAPGHALPDARAYEQVSPENKFGSLIFPISLINGMVQASEDGNALTYTASGPIVGAPPTNRSPEPSQNLSRRGSSAWMTEAIGTPHTGRPGGFGASEGSEYEFFSGNLSEGLVTPAAHEVTPPNEPLLAPEATETGPFWRALTTPSSACEPTPSACYHELVSPLNFKGSEPYGNKIHFSNATPDGRSAVVRSEVALTPEPINGFGLYEWQAGGALKPVAILPAGETGPPENPKLGGAAIANGGIMRNAISSDGSHVFWSTGENTLSPGPLYLRDTVKGETLRIDRAQGGAPEPSAGRAQFQQASTDGSRVFFTDTAPLLPNSTTVAVGEGEETAEESGNLGIGDLYVCEVTETGGKLGCVLTDLTAKGEGAVEGATVQGFIGASEDGTYAYFVADGALGANAGPGRCTPRSEAEVFKEQFKELAVRHCNLYVAHRAANGWATPTHIATLTSEDQPDWFPESGALGKLTARVSPNGRFLGFMSNSSLTGYDNTAANPEAHGAKAEEVFLYDAGANAVSCPSCNSSPTTRPNAVRDRTVIAVERSGQTAHEGTGPKLLVDAAENWVGRWLAATLPGWTARAPDAAIYQSRYLSSSGRLFFEAADKLVEADTNATMDVYQYEPTGEGSCSSANGCVALLSSGASPEESSFLDASVTGNDVFMLTSAQLLKQDSDSGYDVYDARVCSEAAPCLGAPPLPQTPCGDEAKCKLPAAQVPAPPAVPPSAAVSGPGNHGTTQIIGETGTSKPSSKPTRSQKLRVALKRCKKLKKHKKRVACERVARRHFGPLKHAHKASTLPGRRG